MRRFVKLWAALLLIGGGAQAAVYNVRDYGAKADKVANDAPAIQAAIDACTQAGGGEVLVPAGNYLVGHFDLKSNVALNLQDGAVLWASSRWEDYDWDSYEKAHPPVRRGIRNGAGRTGAVRRQRNAVLITADGQRNISLLGEGTIMGTGHGELDRRTDGNPGFVRMALVIPHRYNLVQFNRCQDVHIRDVKFRDADRYTIFLSQCERVWVEGVSIVNNYWHTETDGIDPTACKDVFISNCYIITGDDCICAKTSADNLVVTNCILQTVATGIKLGTNTEGPFRHIQVSNCVIRNTGIGIGFYMMDGGTAEGLSFDNISIETTTLDTEVGRSLRLSYTPIFIGITQATDQSPIATVRDVSFSNIQISSDYSIVLQGMAQSPIRNLTLRNITFRVPRGFDFSERRVPTGGRGNPHDLRAVRAPSYLALSNIDGLEVDDVRVLMSEDIFRKFDRAALAVFDSRDGVIRDVERRPAGTEVNQSAVELTDCRNVRLDPN